MLSKSKPLILLEKLSISFNLQLNFKRLLYKLKPECLSKKQCAQILYEQELKTTLLKAKFDREKRELFK